MKLQCKACLRFGYFTLTGCLVGVQKILHSNDIKFPPLNELIFTKLFAEEKFSFQASNIGERQGDVSVTIAGITDHKLGCQLYDDQSKKIAESCTVISSEGNTTFLFTKLGHGKFAGRLFQKVESKEKILGYFKIER